MGSSRNRGRNKGRTFQGNQHRPMPRPAGANVAGQDVPRPAGANVAGQDVDPNNVRPINNVDNETACSTDLSASERKLKRPRDINDNNSTSDDDLGLGMCRDGFVFVSIELLSNFMEANLICPNCKNEVTCALDTDAKQGFCHYIQIQCTECDWESVFQTSKDVPSKKIVQGKHTKEINMRMVAFSRAIGKGHACLEKLCMFANSPKPMTHHAYGKIFDKVLEASNTVAEESMKVAMNELRQEEEGMTDIAVSLDGTWQRRGRSSHHGIVTAISVSSGKCIDFEVLTNSCKGCRLWDNKDKNSEDYIQWKQNHECNLNHEGSACAMEPEGAVRIFKRSVETRNLRYTKYLGDGDTASYKKVAEEMPYGPECEITKLECVGHVQKRCGKRLRDLIKQKKGTKLSDGKGINGKGRLTEQKINALQNYYGIAIRKNANNLIGMVQSVKAVLPHIASSDSDPQHHKCPSGEDTWCNYNRDPVAYKHKYGLPKAIVKEVEPIFTFLASENLLSKCLHGKTQNVNECLNKLIWDRCSKEYFVENPVIQDACNMAIGHFNDGCGSVLQLFKHLNIEAGTFTRFACESHDNRRVQKAGRKSSERGKRRRTYLRHLKKGWADKKQEEEGDLYTPGGH